MFFKDLEDARTEVGSADKSLFEYLAACEMNYAISVVSTGHVRGKKEDIGSFLVTEWHVVSVLPKLSRTDLFTGFVVIVCYFC